MQSAEGERKRSSLGVGRRGRRLRPEGGRERRERGLGFGPEMVGAAALRRLPPTPPRPGGLQPIPKGATEDPTSSPGPGGRHPSTSEYKRDPRIGSAHLGPRPCPQGARPISHCAGSAGAAASTRSSVGVCRRAWRLTARAAGPNPGWSRAGEDPGSHATNNSSH